ncbi:MAG TPA: IS200/IS605 family transposase [Longimicrobiaceae bacterium]|nr:IS200/IS605 family transposase [Longimicrobiaceae bacterium]
MRAPYTQLYLHLVWATWDRWPLITPEVRDVVYSAIQAQATRIGAEIIAIGGVADHVHVITRFPTTITIADLVRMLKGATSHLIANEVHPGETFKWQGGYGAFTLSKRAIPQARAYVLNQERHHHFGTLHAELEQIHA